ncbi:MAG: hypothetical protein L0I62_01875 [Gammaproteobacteria bacterium]|nr:hypothetical protein [Gammaproteobacteria bacterium]
MYNKLLRRMTPMRVFLVFLFLFLCITTVLVGFEVPRALSQRPLHGPQPVEAVSRNAVTVLEAMHQGRSGSAASFTGLRDRGRS